MKKKDKKNLLINKKISILIVVATLFMGIGYAVVNSIIMDIEGTTIVKKQNGVYITSVEYVSDVSANVEKSSIINAYQTMLNSSITLSDSISSSSLTYSITIYNSSDVTYYFDQVEYLVDETTYSNENIVFKLEGLNKNDALDSKNSITFNITFYYKDSILSENNTLNSYLNFLFKKINSISYVNISESNLPKEVLENELVSIDLNEKAPLLQQLVIQVHMLLLE